VTAYAQRSVRAFLGALASEEPAPGGGSAAALAGALGAALFCMVCRIMASRSLPAGRRRMVERSLVACRRDAEELLRLVEEDARAYGSLVAAGRGGGRQRRQSIARRRAEGDALAVPLRICARTGATLQRASRLKKAAGWPLASDVVAGAALLTGGFLGAAAMALANAQEMGSRASVASLERDVRALLGKLPSLLSFRG